MHSTHQFVFCISTSLHSLIDPFVMFVQYFYFLNFFSNCRIL